MKILIIKNDTTASVSLVNQISSLGFDVKSASNAEDGYQKYLELNPDILIADVNLELIEKIREIDKIVGIVLLAKEDKPEYILASAQLNVKFFIEPLSDIHVRKILESLMIELENCSIVGGDSKLLEEYKKVVDVSSIVSKTNTKGIITFVNDEFCKIAGYEREELLGKNHNIVRHPNMPKSAFEDLWKTIKAKKIWKGLVENLKKDGGSYFVKATIVPVLDELDNIVEFIGLREDITDLMEKEKEIERLNAQNLKTVVDKAFSVKTSELLESIPAPLISIDKNDNILQYNDEFYKLFSIDTANEFLIKLSDNKANIGDIINFENNEECDDDNEVGLLDWKDEMIAFGENLDVEFKHENSGKRFSLRIKENQENSFIVAFSEENV